jgi:hypothetical protein
MMSNSFFYHTFREAVVIGEIIITWIHTDKYVTDVMTNSLPGGDPRENQLQAMF